MCLFLRGSWLALSRKKVKNFLEYFNEIVGNYVYKMLIFSLMKIRIVVLFLFSGFILSFCGVFDPTNYDPQKSPPTGTIEQRDAWGKKHLGITYQQTINWVKQAKIVKEQIGNVISVAPLGMPNYVESTFTDGLVGYHTVEIIGDKGSAIFSAKGVAPYETQDNICFSEGILTTKHNRIEVHCSGSTMAEFNRAKRKQLSDRYKMANLNQKIDLFKVQILLYVAACLRSSFVKVEN